MAHPPSTTRLAQTRIGAIRIRLIVLATALCVASAARPARADGDDEAPAYAVQNRAFHLHNELHLGVGTLPMNAFTKGVTVGGGYTYHFSELWAWEVAQLEYSFGVDTSLKEQLLQVKENATDVKIVSFVGLSSIVFKPIYGKLALTNRWVAHVEVYFTLGPAVGGFNYVDPSFAPSNSSGPALVLFGFNVGAGMRFFVSEWFSVRFDVRDYTFFGSGTQDELYLGLAGAFTFGGRAHAKNDGSAGMAQ